MAVNTFSEGTSLDHETYSADANDTSVILVSGGADLDLSYVDVIKYGYASNLLSASFWGFNAAINVVRSHNTNPPVPELIVSCIFSLHSFSCLSC